MTTITEDQLYQYIDGELGPDEAAEIEAAMEADLGLRARFEARLSENDLIKEAAGYLDTGHANLETKRLEKRLAQALSKKRRVPSRVIVFPQWPMQLAAACALVAFGWWGNNMVQDSSFHMTGLPEYVQDARGAHMLFADAGDYAVEFAVSDIGNALSWLSNRYGSEFPSPDLTELGAELVGARLLTSRDEPVLHYLYQGSEGELFSIVVKPHNQQEPTRGFEMASYPGSEVGFWQNADFDYAVVTEAGFTGPTTVAGLLVR